MKKLIYGLFVAASALVFSAYTNAQQEYHFYRVSGPTNSTDPQDYEYLTGATCDPSPENCSVTETLPTEPEIGDNPSPSAMNDIQEGTPDLP